MYPFGFSTESVPHDVEITNDGAQMFMIGTSQDRLYVYDLTSPYDVTTATNRRILIDTSNFEGGPQGLALSGDESKIHILGNFSDSLFALDLKNAFDKLTIASGTADINSGGFSFGGIELLAASTTNRNVLIGESAGLNTTVLTTDNVFIGYEAGLNASSSAHDNLVLVGYQAGRNILASAASNTVAVGYQAGFNAGGVENVYLSSFAGYANRGNYNAIGGYRAGYSNAGDFGVMFGVEAGELNTGDYAILFGVRAGESNTGNHVIAMGSSTGQNNTADHVVALGFGAAQNNTGDLLVAIGQFAGQNNTGLGNNFVGRYAGAENTGPYNNFIGHEAGRFLQSTSSVVLGAFAMRGSSSYQAVNNVAVGHMAGYGAQTGASNNILIGYKAADNITTGSNNIFIGYDMDLQDPTQSNTLSIANLIFGTGLTSTGTALSTGNIGIGTSSPTAQLHTTGSVRLANFGAGNLTTDASGNVSVSSDENLKEVVTLYTNGAQSVLGINPIVYRWNEVSGFETLTEYIGFSAQNVQENIPGSVGTDPHGYLTLSGRGILATVVNAVKEVWTSLLGTNEVLDDTEADLLAVTDELSELNKTLSDYEERISVLKQLSDNTESDDSDSDSGSGSTDGDTSNSSTTASSTASSTASTSVPESTEQTSTTSTSTTTPIVETSTTTASSTPNTEVSTSTPEMSTTTETTTEEPSTANSTPESQPEEPITESATTTEPVIEESESDKPPEEPVQEPVEEEPQEDEPEIEPEPEDEEVSEPVKEVVEEPIEEVKDVVE